MMSKTSTWGKAAMSAMITAAAVICSGCPHNNQAGSDKGSKFHRFTHNLAHLHCGNNHAGENYRIDLAANAHVLKERDDTLVFVCENDTLSWFISDSSYVITVVFSDSYAGDLFQEGRSKFESKQGDPTSQAHTPKVKTPGDLGQVYKYSIEINDGHGHDYRIDPHVIPMGK